MPAAVIKVAMVGATGKTGASVVNGLLASKDTKFEITALSRPSSLDSEANQKLRARDNVQVVGVDLQGPKDELVAALKGIDVVISCIVWTAFLDQIPLAEAAKEAGVKRFVPCEFGTPAPRGIMRLNDVKYQVLDAIMRLYLPYTVIHVGWWMEQAAATFPLPSGRLNDRVHDLFSVVPGDGDVPMAWTSLPDIGHYVARIVADPRTLKQKVLAYTEVKSMNETADILDQVSGEKAVRNCVPATKIKADIEAAEATLVKSPDDLPALYTAVINQYRYSWGVRGDNTPKSAKYLGFLDFQELFGPAAVEGKTTLRSMFEDILAAGGSKTTAADELLPETLKTFVEGK